MHLTIIDQVQVQVPIPSHQPSQHPVDPAHPAATGSPISNTSPTSPTPSLPNLPLPTQLFLQMMKGYLNGPSLPY